MNAKLNHIENLAETLAVLLEQEKRACQELITALVEAVRLIQGDTGDRRMQRLVTQLKTLQDRIALLVQMATEDFLAKIKTAAETLKQNLTDSRLAAILTALIDVQPAGAGLNRFCEALLDHLIAATNAERGFVLFYLPETSEAEVIAARRFQTMNLSLDEYDFSRTLLHEVFQRGEPLRLEDVSQHQDYAKEISVQKFGIKSVLIVPLQQDQRTVGALYLENNSRPAAFAAEDLLLLRSVAHFVMFYFQQARLLPIIFSQDHCIFFDPNQAAKEIVGQETKILQLQEVIQRIADSPAMVLISGESGTGKELVARALHYQSARRERPFVVINCAAIPEPLMESELFGHEKGAFTGATERYIGRIEQGNGGTIFLDEVSELGYTMQAKLLRFLQASEFDRLGGKETIHVDVRLVAATSKDLKVLVQAGKFQEALYYRLNVIPIDLPPLRERKHDVTLLVDHFLNKFCAVYHKNLRLEQEVYACLQAYAFPGNVRELENLIHRLVALAIEDTIHLSDLPREVLSFTSQRISLAKNPLYRILHTELTDIGDLRRREQEIKRIFAEKERQLLERAVQEAHGNMTAAANRLGVHRVTLHKMLKRTSKK